TQQPVSIRAYPYGPMAAQVLGYVGQISPMELKLRAFRGVKQGTVVGQEGLEYYYDRYLRGNPGVQRVEVNASGYPVPSTLPATQPVAGQSLKVTIDLRLEREGEKALLEGMEHARASGKAAVAGSFVALDPRNGEVLAIGSAPSFDPNKFAKPLTESEYAALEGKASTSGSSEESPAPLTDRAVNGTYPTGSTFKPITAMGALEAGVIDPSMGLGGGQCIYVSTEAFCNAGKADYGPVGLVVGQGDLLTSPLQMAVAYSTLADALSGGGEGTVVRPHLGKEIDGSQGRLVQALGFPPARHVHLNPSDVGLVMEGIHEAASQPGGTSADVWSGWNQEQHPVYGKTGTAEHVGKEDQSWYMCYVADPSRPIVIAVTVEQGGFGAETAAPIARLIASQWFGKPKRFISGTSKTF